MGLAKPQAYPVWRCHSTGTLCGSELWKMEPVCFCNSCQQWRNGNTDTEATIQEMNRVSSNKPKP